MVIKHRIIISYHDVSHVQAYIPVLLDLAKPICQEYCLKEPITEYLKSEL